MRREEVPQLSIQLNALAEVYDKRHLTPQAVQVWVDTLKEFPTERIMGLLIDWPKAHVKFPTPAEVWRYLNEKAIDEREQKNAEEKKRYEAEFQQLGGTEHGRMLLGVIRGFLSKSKRIDPKQWARDIIEAHEADDVLYFTHPDGRKLPRTGDKISPLQLQLAREALGLDPKTGLSKSREPGQDDEERMAA